MNKSTLSQSDTSKEDEIDLKEVLVTLWKGKWIIIICTLLFGLGAVVYALTAQELWSSKAKITLPQAYDFSEFEQQVKKFQPIFDFYQEDGSGLVNEELNFLIDKEELFLSFITEFNSSKNQKDFLLGDDVNHSLQTDEGMSANVDTKKGIHHSSIVSVKKISASEANNGTFDLTTQATTKSDSHRILNDYTEYVSKINQQNLLINLQAIIKSKENELLQQRNVLRLQAKRRLGVEIQKTEYALQITLEANVSQPIHNLVDNGIFAIHLGSEVIKAKLKALKKADSLSLFESISLQQVESQLALVKNTSLDKNIHFGTFRFLDEPQEPLNRDQPKRLIVVLLGTLLGGMLGVVIVLCSYIFRRYETE